MSVLAKLNAFSPRQTGRGERPAQSRPVVGRLIISPPGDGPMNMAIDDALLNGTTADSPSTLRLYRWSQPTLSLGYFQTIASRSEHAASNQLAVVRRASGGGAIIHDHELTYSLIFSSSGRSNRGAASDIYRAVHTAMIEILADFGIFAQRFADTCTKARHAEPFLCFQRRTDEDLVLSGYKVLGSAQRRGKVGLLQHGSLLLSSSISAPELPGINELTSRSVQLTSLIEPFAERLSAVCGVQWEPGKPTPGEIAAANQVLADKFSSIEWTAKR